MSGATNDGLTDVTMTVTFEYIKNPAFRVLHADGLIGGVTPSGNIHMAFYSERPPFPRKLTYTVEQDGTLGGPVPALTEAREGLIRELDVDVVMSLAVAESMIQWLTTQIKIRKAEFQPVQDASA